MNLNRIAVVCALTIVGTAGCASDPGRKANAAEAELSSEQQRTSNEEQDKNAEATRKHESKNAEASSDKNLATSEAKKDVNDAHADLSQERRDADTKAKERLAKVDARAKELKTKSSKLTGKKAADFKAHYATFTTERGEANTKVSSLGTSTNDGWSTAKTDLEKKLDGLESTVDSMGKDF